MTTTRASGGAHVVMGLVLLAACKGGGGGEGEDSETGDTTQGPGPGTSAETTRGSTTGPGSETADSGSGGTDDTGTTTSTDARTTAGTGVPTRARRLPGPGRSIARASPEPRSRPRSFTARLREGNAIAPRSRLGDTHPKHHVHALLLAHRRARHLQLHRPEARV